MSVKTTKKNPTKKPVTKKPKLSAQELKVLKEEMKEEARQELLAEAASHIDTEKELTPYTGNAVEVAEKVATEPQTAIESTEAKRILAKSLEIYHDLFLLNICKTKKIVGWNENDPDYYKSVNHKHYYHTVGSDGKKLPNSAPTAGHYHKITVTKDLETNELVANCGPPMVRHKGKDHPYKNDKHIHDVSYIGSDMVKRRVYNDHVAKAMAFEQREEININKQAASFIRK